MKNDSWLKKISENHHLYLISGVKNDIEPELNGFLEEEWSFPVKANPDFFTRHYPTLYVEDCELIRNKAQSKALNNDRKVFIISFGFITRESANSLLKIFEDPPSNVFFFVITPNSEKLPDTLKSRFSEIKVIQKIDKEFEKQADDFLKMSLADKLSFSKKISDDISKENMTRAEAVSIFKSIEMILKDKFKIDHKNVSLFKEIDKSLSYSMDQSASVKIIFDQLSLLTEELKSIR